MDEWYEAITEDELWATANSLPDQSSDVQHKKEQEDQYKAQSEQKAAQLNFLLGRLRQRFPPLFDEFRDDIEGIETLDLLKRLTLNLALARHETVARQAILAAIHASRAENPDTDDTSFLLF